MEYASMLVPQILQMCLQEADSPMGVIEQAMKLRDKPWVKSFSQHIKELSHINSHQELLRKVKTMESYVEKRLKGAIALESGGVSVTRHGKEQLMLSH